MIRRILIPFLVCLCLGGALLGVLRFPSSERPFLLPKVAGCFGLDNADRPSLRVHPQGWISFQDSRVRFRVILDNIGTAIEPAGRIVADDRNGVILKGNGVPLLLRFDKKFSTISVPTEARTGFAVLQRSPCQ